MKMPIVLILLSSLLCALGSLAVDEAPKRPAVPASLPKGPPPSDVAPPPRTLTIPPVLLTKPLEDALGANKGYFCSKGDYFAGKTTIRSGAGDKCKTLPGAVIAEFICRDFDSYNTSECRKNALKAQFIRDNVTYTLKNENNLPALMAEEIVQKGPNAICGFMAGFVKDSKFAKDCLTKLNNALSAIQGAFKK